MSKKLDRTKLMGNVVAMLREYDEARTSRYNLDKEELTPLHLAALEGRLDVVQKLLETKYPVDEANRDSQRAIHLAIQNGHLEVVKCLVENGSDINSCNGGPPPLAFAIASNRMDALKYLVEKGAALEFELIDPEGLYEQKIFQTFLEEKEPLFHYKILKSAFASHLGSGHKITAVHVAIRRSRLEMLKYLLEHVAPGTSLDEGPFSPLHIAAKKGDLEILKYLTDSRTLNVDTADKILTPLHLAAMYDHIEVVEFLVQKLKAKTEVTCIKCEYSPLHMAALGDCLKIIKCLVRNGAKVSVFDDEGNTPLHLAVRVSLEAVRCLVESGAPILTTNTNNCTALHFAAAGEPTVNGPEEKSLDFVDTVKYLVEHGADINAVDKGGQTPLHVAAINGNLETVKFLTRIGADVNAQFEEERRTPLHQAVFFDQVAIVEYLLDFGAQVNLPDSEGLMPLHVAAGRGHLDCVKCLVQNGANINAIQTNIATPLFLAVLQSEAAVVKYLLEAGADPNICDGDDRSPILNVLKFKLTSEAENENKDHDEIIEALIKHGADLNLPNVDGLYPLVLAVYVQDLELVKFLIVKGANVDGTSTAKISPLLAAVERGFLDVVKCLMEKGASLVGHPGCNGYTALHFLADTPPPLSLTHLEILKYLVEEKSHPLDTKADDDITPLHLACGHDNLPLAQYLINAGAQVNVDGENGTPLGAAVQTGNMNLVEYLIEQGADVNRGDPSPLSMAFLRQNLDMVKYLISKGAEVNKVDREHPSYSDALLEFAVAVVSDKALELVKYLIEELGANPLNKDECKYNFLQSCARHDRWSIVNYLNKGVEFPLHEAARSGNLETVKSLVEAGEIPIDFNETIGFTPLQLAAEGGHTEVAKFLIEKGADITARNFHASVLHFSVGFKRETTDCLVLILDALNEKFGDDPEKIHALINAPDSDGDTPLMWGIEYNQINPVRILLEYGADTAVTNKKGENALDWAKKKENAEIIKMLGEESADDEPESKSEPDKNDNVDVNEPEAELSANNNNCVSIAAAISIDDLSGNLARVIVEDATDNVRNSKLSEMDPIQEQNDLFTKERMSQDMAAVTMTSPVLKLSSRIIIGDDADNDGLPNENVKKCKICCSIM